VDGQQTVAERKARKVYETLDAYPDVYRVVPDKCVRSRMNICFRVIKVILNPSLSLHAVTDMV
jgi:phosphoserine aminotransferase